MSDETTGDARSPQVEAVQAVVDRVTSWQDGAPRPTVREELLKGLEETGVTVPEGFVDAVVEHIHHQGEHLDVEPLLRQAEGGPRAS
jgi:hypothetical protein